MREVLNGVFLCSGDRLPVARLAERPAAEIHGARLPHAVELGRHAGARPSRALPHDPGVGRPRGLAECRGDRQPEREKRGKRGARIDPSGTDAGKKVKGKKRHLLVDTLGLILSVVVHPADLQDRDGALLVLNRQTRRLFPFLETIFADGAYGGQKLRRAMADAAWRIEVVKRFAQAKGFESSQDAGSSSAPSPGSIAAGAWPRTTKTSTEPPSPSSDWRASGSCSEDSPSIVIPHELSGQTLISHEETWRCRRIGRSLRRYSKRRRFPGESAGPLYQRHCPHHRPRDECQSGRRRKLDAGLAARIRSRADEYWPSAPRLLSGVERSYRRPGPDFRD